MLAYLDNQNVRKVGFCRCSGMSTFEGYGMVVVDMYKAKAYNEFNYSITPIELIS